jgi:hypothetical protein
MKKWEEVDGVMDRGYTAYKFHEPLSSGQVVGVYFHLTRSDMFNLAVTIQDSKEKCDAWLDSGDTSKETGKCGLEGLATSYRLLKWFITNRLEDGYKIKINGYNKRGRAYKFVERLGFKLQYNEYMDLEDRIYVFQK